ncbi:MAG: deoxyribose-phosphate aldolase [Candidatus Acidiferrales bacterium]
MTPAEIARLIDHTLLKPEATREDVERMCQEALRFEFASVCVNARYAAQVAEALHGSAVKTCVVVGFPLGATLTSVKVFETNEALRLGAREIDMAIAISALKSGDDAAVESEIRAVTEVAHQGGAIDKIIIEAGLLTEGEKMRACKAAVSAGVDFVKTSTGFGHGGATVEDVRLIRRAVGAKIGVKASGGIRSLHDCLQMLAAGATRIGTSSGVNIVEEARTATNGKT